MILLVPLRISVEQNGTTVLKSDQASIKFELNCKTNINKQLNLEISWAKDGKDLLIDDQLYSSRTDSSLNYLNNILEFKTLNFNKKDNYSGVYKCKIYNRISDVSQSSSYFSDPKVLQFSYYCKLQSFIL